MSTLFGSLSIALRALLAQQGALNTTSNNIANVNTRGFSRQRAVLREEPPVLYGSLLFGAGVGIEKVESIRDRVLELRIYQETQQDGKLEAFLGAMRQVESLFNEAQGGGLQGVLSKFFDSLLALSANPSDLPLRQAVLTGAQNLTDAFNRTANNLAALQNNLNQSVVQIVDEINRLTVEIADLNRRVSTLEGASQEPGAFADRRNLLIRQLSRLVDVAVIDAGGGSLTITTSAGTALVVGDTSVPLSTQVDSTTGFQHISVQGTDITTKLVGGRIGGFLELRDQTIPSVLADLDNLAASLANNFNSQHRAGFDLSGAPGVDFFVPPPGSGVGAAATFAVALTDPAQLAASSDGAPGSNSNLTALVALRDQAIVAGQQPIEFYAGLVSRIGNDIATALAEQEAESLVLRQLENQRLAISGVSLDEEAVNLLRFQRAFEAAARVVAVVDELTQTAINLGRA